jgi:hypothetical protein
MGSHISSLFNNYSFKVLYKLVLVSSFFKLLRDYKL